MNTGDYLKILTEEIHSTVAATIDKEGHPVTRCIDMMLYDDNGVYFLTAVGKEFYVQLMDQKYISLSGIQNKKCISLQGKVKNIAHQKLHEIFEKNPYMQRIYPEGTRDALEVFCIYEANGNFFDISDPSHIERGTFSIGNAETGKFGYVIEKGCIGCGICLDACPQKCIEINDTAHINQNHCLHCGRCVAVCPVNAIVHIA